MATTADAVTYVVREGLQSGVRDARLKVDPIFADFIEDNVSAVRDQQGRGWNVLHSFVVSNAGAFRVYGDANGGDIVYGDTAGQTAVSYDASTPRAFPGLTEFVAPNFAQRTINLKQWTGNIFLPHSILRSDQLTAAIAKVVELTISGVSRSFAQWRANLFFSRDTTNKAIGSINHAAVTGGTTSDSTVTFTLLTGRIRRFQPGMLVDVYDSTGTTRRNTSPLVVQHVDALSKSIRLDHTQKTSGHYCYFSTDVCASSSDDIIVMRNSKGYGPSGLMDWIKSSGSIFGLNLTYYPQFKSALISSLGAALTDQALNTLIGYVGDAWGTDSEPDTFLTTQGVITGYVGEYDTMRAWYLTNSPQNVQGGYSSYGFTIDGRKKEFKTSSLIDEGYLYGLKAKNNIRRYVPPGLPKAGTNGTVSGELEFIAPVGGFNGIWAPFISTDGEITDFVQAPFTMCEEYAPEEPRALVIGGITPATYPTWA